MTKPETPAVKPRPLIERLQLLLDCHRVAAVKHRESKREAKAQEHDAHEQTAKEAIEKLRKKDKPGVIPTLDECKFFALEIGMDPEEGRLFFLHFASNGWKVGGKAAMKDWRAALHMWKHRRDKETPKPANGNGVIGHGHKQADPNDWRKFIDNHSYPYVRYADAKGWMRSEHAAWRRK